jgi:transposase-like protein
MTAGGFLDVNAVFPLAQVQPCIVDRIRHAMGFAASKEGQPVAAALEHVLKKVARLFRFRHAPTYRY